MTNKYKKYLELAKKQAAILQKHCASPIKLAFTYQTDEDQFNPENWNDPIVSYVRKQLENWTDHNHNTKLLQITPFYDSYNDETLYVVQLDSELITISWYKNRGRVENMINITQNGPLQCEQFIELYEELKKNKPQKNQ